MKQPHLYVIHAAAIRDAAGVSARPGSVLIKGGRIVAAGEPESLPRELVEQAGVIDKRSCLLLPQMVNAHTHLELTDIGPQPYDEAGGFAGWVLMLRSHWPDGPSPGVLPDDWFVKGARRGVELSHQAGIQAIGDISQFISVGDACRASGMDGQHYLEVFGLGSPFDEHGLRTIAQSQGGLQPHAPYSAGSSLFEAAARSGRPVSCHLAETRDELDFVGRLRGPLFDFIQSIEKWDASFAEQYSQGLTPVQWMRPYLERAAADGGWLAAHCNYVSDEDIDILASTNTSVAYCPLASEYFGHTGHRYREMLDAGVNVCLGTDSIVGTNPMDPQPLGVMSAMRRLYSRDAIDPDALLAMATTRGSKALRMDEPFATLRGHARFACVEVDPDGPADPLVQVLTSQAPVES